MYNSEEHENIINELIQSINVDGVDMAKVSLLIQDLRNNYNDVNTTFADNTLKLEETTKSIEDLRGANNKLLVQLGTQYSDILGRDKNEIINQKTKAAEQTQQTNEEKPMTLDDLANELI